MKRRWKPIVVGLALLVPVALVVSLAAVYAHYSDPAYIRSAAEQYMQQFTTGRVTIGRASFSWLEGLRLYDVALYEPEASPRPTSTAASRSLDDAIFTCPHVLLETDLIASLWGQLTITSVVATEPTCSIVRNAHDGSTNLAGLIGSAEFGESQRPLTLPTIELRDARILVVARDSHRSRVVEDLVLTIRARPSTHDPAIYDVAWQAGAGRKSSGRSLVDLGTGHVRNVEGGLPWMSIEGIMSVINARFDGAAAWSELLGLDGTVRARDYGIGGDADDRGRRSAAIELREASISIPVTDAERSLPRGERYLRFDRVNGNVRFTRDMIHAEFTGFFHGSECH
ncbi:MAG: hypothetical protein IIC51_08955, partial [Planctomycetes bacterium]|nr:hypothetical protein [Planctomycetota bacterium]